MKKIFIFTAALAALFSCSSNEEAPDFEQTQPVGELVDAEIGVGMGKALTSRAYLGDVTPDVDEGGNLLGTYTIVHQFEAYDEMYITDYLGQHEFKVERNGQTTSVKGQWAKIDEDETKNGILATFPKSAVTQKPTVTANRPTMYFTLPTEQTPYVYDRVAANPQLSYDRSAGLAFACANNKTDNLWFLPVVSYLYFYSKESQCEISSTVGIAGEYTVTYSGELGTGKQGDYGTAEGLSKYLTYTATDKTITCHGKHIEHHRNQFENNATDYYEYIIAIKPGTYAANSIKITPQGATKSLYCPSMELIPSDLYFIGTIDASTN